MIRFIIAIECYHFPYICFLYALIMSKNIDNQTNT